MPDGYRLREATEVDVDVIVRMREALQSHIEASDPAVWKKSSEGWAWIADEVLADVTGDRARVLVAETTDGAIVAVAVGKLGSRSDMDPAAFGQIDDVWVESAHRRRGLCRALALDLCDWFRRSGCAQVVVRWAIGNTEADQTWRALGLVPRVATASAPLAVVTQRLNGR